MENKTYRIYWSDGDEEVVLADELEDILQNSDREIDYFEEE